MDCAAANLVILLMTAGMFGVVFLFVQFLQNTVGYTPLEAGVRTLPWTVMPILAAPVGAAMADRCGERPVIAVSLALHVVSLGWLAVITAPDVSYPALVPPLALAGATMGLFYALIVRQVLGFVAAEDEGLASGVNNALRALGVVLGIATLSAVFSAAGGADAGPGFVRGLVPAMWTGTGLVLLAFTAALFVPRPEVPA